MSEQKSEQQHVRTDHRTRMDWQQVVLNGGPPCFFDDSKGWYCGRAKRWEGHGAVHRFVPLETLVADALLSRWNREMLTSAENELKEMRNCEKCDLCDDHHD